VQLLRGTYPNLLLQVAAVASLLVLALVLTDARSAGDSPESAKRDRPPGASAPDVSAIAARELAAGRRHAATIAALYRGIPQHGAVLGRERAPVTLRFFADLECPQARELALEVFPRLIRRWVRPGQVRIEYRARTAETIWPRIYTRQQVAALAAGRQQRLWQYLTFFYLYQGPEYTKYADERFLTAMAREVGGLDLAAWRADRDDPELALRVDEDRRTASARGIGATPAFLVGPTGGPERRLRIFSFSDSLAFEEAIEAALPSG
jgi:protein-disulfide isomerase